jgi:twitching motility protein PilT
MDVVSYLKRMADEEASDLFLTAGKPPHMRVAGALQELDPTPVDEKALESFLRDRLPGGVPDRVHQERDLDIGLSLDEICRFRINIYFEMGRMAMAVRRVPCGALNMADLNIPDTVRDLVERPRGLVLITGATSSGKSTTLAAMLHHLNSTQARHIVTIEDPIEFVHQDIKSIVTQREVGADTRDFATALRHVVRQNPDAIFIGEMRDLESIRTAISAAMTGHLVVATMHTMDPTQTLERIVNYFPGELQAQVAADLGLCLAGIVSQRLLPRDDKPGLVPAFEILIGTPLVRRLVGSRDLDQIPQVIKENEEEGMVTFTRYLSRLFERRMISLEAGTTAATNKEEFLLAVEGMETGVDTLRAQLIAREASQTVGMKALLRTAVRNRSSDLILTVGSPPMLRIGGDLKACELPELTGADTRALLFSVLTPNQRTAFETAREIDFALSVSGLGDGDGQKDPGGDRYRFRVNGFFQKGQVASAVRLIPQRIPDAAQLRIPPMVMAMAQRHQGLILVTGPTGHGKSTTLSCLINQINETRSCHIITVEDPIEFVHASKRAVVEQREVFADTKSFATALKYVLRQDPDVILVGEMRDIETISSALTAAETGHLVLATLHTNDAAQTVDRIIDVFPASQQNQVRSQLASCLLAVISQRLLPRLDNPEERIAAFEVLLATTAVRALVRDKRTHQLLSTMETSAKEGMVTLDKALEELYFSNLITRQTFRAVARHPDSIL